MLRHEQRDSRLIPPRSCPNNGVHLNQQASQEDEPDQKAEDPGRADTRAARRKAAETPGLRPPAVPDSGTEGTASPHRSGKAGRGQAARPLRRMRGDSHLRRDPVRALRRESPAVPKAGEEKGRSAEGAGLRTDSHLLKTTQTRAADSSSRPGSGADQDVCHFYPQEDTYKVA